MKERALAIVGAVALIVVALALRSHFAGDGGDGGSGNGSSDGGAPVVACTEDLAEVCAQLADEGQIADDPPTLSLADASSPDAVDGIDGWITWQPTSEVANLDQTDERTWDPPILLGSAPLAVLATQDDLDAACPGDVTWRCVAGRGSNDLSVGVGSPTAAEGLARLLPVARTFAEDDDYQTLQRQALRALLESPPTGQDDAPTMVRRLTTQPGSVALVIGPQPLLDAEAATEQGQARELVVAAPTPSASASVVIAPRAGTELDVDGWCEDAGRALTAVGVAPCKGKLSGDDLAGFLWQVREKVG